ncbi:MAG: hypothetical protein NW206_02115 [Hyphomonadaceae bacterium]|nr:hypothetical protein [Hyphomonadaceae bacterium]
MKIVANITGKLRARVKTKEWAMIRLKICQALFAVTLFNVGVAAAQQLATYDCPVTRKTDSDGRIYSSEELARWQFAVRVIEGPTTIIQRCSFSSIAVRVTCDSYTSDRIERDASVGVQKFYYFRGQYDVQIFSDGTFIENNGRGGIAFGRCERS